MSQTELRAEPRISLSCRGLLTLGETSAPCLIQNMCSRGFLIKYAAGLPVGQVLGLKCELDHAGSIECKVQVRHVNAECLGARVVEISDQDKAVCQQFLAARRPAN